MRATGPTRLPPVETPPPDSTSMPAATQHSAKVRQGPVSYQVEDDVVPVPVPSEVFAGVVDDAVGAERADQVDVASAAHGGHVGAQVDRDLHGERTDATGGTVDQNPLPGGHLGNVAETRQRGVGGQWHCRCLLWGELFRLGGQQIRGYADVLGERAVGLAIDLVAGTELSYAVSDRLHNPGEVGAAHGDPGVSQAHRSGVHQPRDKGIASHEVPVTGVERCRADPHQHLVADRDGGFDVVEPQHLGPPVPLLDDRLHEALLG